MALGCHEACKSAYGAADAAWNETDSSSLGVISLSSCGGLSKGRQNKAGGNVSSGSTSQGSKDKDASLALAVAAARCLFLELPPALILEIFTHLDARELSVVSCVCVLFRRLSWDSHGWKDFYCERWGLPAPSSSGGAYLALPGKHWRELYVAREARSKAMMGRFTMDMLHGHSAAVRCVRLLPPANLICTAGYDQTVRLWNLEEGLPVSCSRSLGETIRAIAVDTSMLAVGGSDSVVRLWHAKTECPHLFDISGGAVAGSRGTETLLYGHMGPVTCLGLNGSNLYSGSWDMSIKVWDRSSLKCTENLRHMDWVWALVQRGRRVLSTAGSDVYTWDAETGQQLRVRMGVHSGQAYAVEGTRSGHIVFTGGEDGGVRMFDDRISRRRTAMTEPNDQGASGVKEAIASWTPHGSAVYSLAFDDPWLVTASGDGSLAVIDVRQIMKRATGTGKYTSLIGTSAKWRRSGHYLVSKEGETAQRRLSGFHQSAYSVDLGADRVVSGGEEKTVRIWDFSQALEIERRVQASRSNQIENRMRRKQVAVVPTELKGHKGKHAEISNNVARKNGMHRPEGVGPSDKDRGQKNLKNRPLLGRNDKSLVPKVPAIDFNRTRLRYVDSVSVPS